MSVNLHFLKLQFVIFAPIISALAKEHDIKEQDLNIVLFKFDFVKSTF